MPAKMKADREYILARMEDIRDRRMEVNGESDGEKRKKE
jgi:hypothetical protein